MSAALNSEEKTKSNKNVYARRKMFTDNSNAVPYKSIKLMKLEYLIGLRDYPAFDLVVWAWRIEEILLVVDTGFRLPNQSLK